MAKPRQSDVTDDRSELFDEEFMKRLEYLHILARRAFSGSNRADRRTKKTGAGIEFADHRKYSAGDDFRYIDWNVYGRADKLLLRLFEEEEDLHIYFLLDSSRSMLIGDPLKLHYAMKLTAALSYVGLGNLDRVGILSFADKLQGRLAPARGKRRIFKVFDFLRSVEAGGETRLDLAAKSFVLQNKRKGLVVVISDFYDPRGFEEGINTLRYNKFEPFVLQVYDEKEANPTLHGDLTLVDCETGDHREVTVSRALLEKYREEHAKYMVELKSFCTERAVPYFRTHTQIPFDDLILRVFRMGGFLR